MERKWIFGLAFSVGALVGCSEQRLDDVSNEPQYEKVVGSAYVVISTVDAYGIKGRDNKEVEYVTLIPPPGIAGPEVGFEMPVKVGSQMTILKVMKTNRWPDPNMTLIVQLDGTVLPVTKEIRVDVFRGNEGEGHVQLNPKIYRKTF